MFELSSESKVAELENESPAMMAALTSTGIFRQGDNPDVTLAELCWDFGLNPVIILNILARARANDLPSNIDVSELDDMTLTQVVEHIESSHHAYLRETLPVILQLIDKVAGVHGGKDDRLADLHALFTKLSTDLENHMLHEEESLFPMVRDIEANGSINPTRCGDAVGGPIACMENEHDIARRELSHLRDLTNGFVIPEHACATYRSMLEELARFEQDMLVHIHKEDKVLFPRSLEAQAALRA